MGIRSIYRMEHGSILWHHLEKLQIFYTTRTLPRDQTRYNAQPLQYFQASQPKSSCLKHSLHTLINYKGGPRTVQFTCSISADFGHGSPSHPASICYCFQDIWRICKRPQLKTRSCSLAVDISFLYIQRAKININTERIVNKLCDKK